MRYRIAVLSMLVMGLAALASPQAAVAETPTADCAQGSTEEQVACLNRKVAALEAKMAEALKWNDRIALGNEDMRIFPRCLENPGPNTPQLTDVYASSCAKVLAQALDDPQALPVGLLQALASPDPGAILDDSGFLTER